MILLPYPLGFRPRLSLFFFRFLGHSFQFLATLALIS